MHIWGWYTLRYCCIIIPSKPVCMYIVHVHVVQILLWLVLRVNWSLRYIVLHFLVGDNFPLGYRNGCPLFDEDTPVVTKCRLHLAQSLIIITYSVHCSTSVLHYTSQYTILQYQCTTYNHSTLHIALYMYMHLSKS